MKKIELYILSIFAVAFLSSCELLVDVVTDDSEETLSYTIDSQLSEISLRGSMDMEIIESDDSLIIIDGPKSIVEKITISKHEGNLTLDYEKIGSWMYEKPLVKVYLPQVNKISLYAHNDLFANDTLRAEKINVFSDGTGDVRLIVNNKSVRITGTNISNFYISGKTESLTVSCSWSSSIKGADLVAQKINIGSYASNHQVVHPIKSLTCNIRHTGNIYYVNQPEELIVNVIEDGTGEAIFDSNRQ